jgi:23S rRNA (adenine1618-N6)-methyltransferase
VHPKNPFAKDYDFDTLVKHHGDLKDFVFVNDYGTKTIKFSEPGAVRALNRALLKARYGIDWNVPEDYLCPPVPGRLDYLLYISDLVSKQEVRMLDIGAGANFIYPILGTCHFNWKCVASEVDRNSLYHAQQIIKQNPVLNTTELRGQKNRNQIFENIIRPKEHFDVVVCNPPYYKNQKESQKENLRKVRSLHLPEDDKLNFGGRSNELWYTGGEEAFIKRMVKESANFKYQVNWFTSLISRKENIRAIKRALRQTFPKEVRIIEMGVGNKTSRFIAWSFMEEEARKHNVELFPRKEGEGE